MKDDYFKEKHPKHIELKKRKRMKQGMHANNNNSKEDDYGNN